MIYSNLIIIVYLTAVYCSLSTFIKFISAVDSDQSPHSATAQLDTIRTETVHKSEFLIAAVAKELNNMPK